MRLVSCTQLMSLSLITLMSFLSFVPASKALGAIQDDLADSLACDDSRARIFGAYYKSHEEPEREDVARERSKNIEIVNSGPADSRARYVRATDQIHRVMTDEMIRLSRNKEAFESEPLLHLIRLEMESQIEPEYTELNERLDRALAEGKEAALELGLTCRPTSEEPIESSDLAPSKNGLYGALKTMATAYQSCSVLDLPPVTADVEIVKGVISATQIDSVGWGRKYTDVGLLKRSHYYHRGVTYGGACVDQSAKPLVYDYAGMPVISSGGRALDMFRNKGGGPALGIDCSAYISTAAAVVGDLYKRSTANRPVYTRFASRDFIDPKKSGWSCYERVGVSDSSTIRPSDIGAVRGHVVMIDQVGSDPFGLSGVKSMAECDSIDVRNYDFTVVQSSSSKEHLGINRYVAKDFLPESEKMAELFLAYGKAACRSKFDRKVRVPSTAAFGLIRHKNESGCKAPAVTLAHEACVARCPQLATSAD